MFRLKELRLKNHLSQVRLAMELNMTQNTICRYENQTREADYKTLVKIADYFNVSIDYLLGRTDNPKINI
jgi:transcriptional regulator with XRE-family HTH domain